MTTYASTTTLRESGGRVLSEARGGKVTFRIISAGWGASGYYSRELLRRDGPQVFREGLHVYLDHPTRTEERERPERSVRDLAGALATHAQWRDSGQHGSGLFAEVRIARQDLRDMLPDLANMIGVSIRATGVAKHGTAEGRSGPIIERLVSADSVDIVTKAGAGGAVLLESLYARQGTSVTEADRRELNADIAQLKREISKLEEQMRNMKVPTWDELRGVARYETSAPNQARTEATGPRAQCAGGLQSSSPCGSGTRGESLPSCLTRNSRCGMTRGIGDEAV